jgi:predicted amidohydrolase
MRIACCQFAPEVGDPEASAARACAALSVAVEAGAGIVVLPELANSGYVFESAEEARAAAVPADGELLARWAEIAAGGDAVVVGGFCELADDGRVFNSAALVDGSGVRAVYRKLHLWGDEPRWFSRGEAPAPVIETAYGRIGVAVCYDLEFPELTRGLALEGADLIALPMNWPREQPRSDGQSVPRLLALNAAYTSRVFVAVCDRAGEERGQGFEGASVIVGPDGVIGAAATPGAGVEMLIADCDLSAARDKRNGPRNDTLADRRPEHYARQLTQPHGAR